MPFRNRIADACFSARKDCVIGKSQTCSRYRSARFLFLLENPSRESVAPSNGDAMQCRDCHLSDQELLLAADGELSAQDTARIDSHLAACWTCRTRKHELEMAVAGFIR